MTKMFCLLVLLAFKFLTAQSFTYAENVKPIIDSKCNTCHLSDDNIRFDTYKSFKAQAKTIEYVISNNIMPPWPPDNQFSKFKHILSLSESEKTSLLQWLQSVDKAEGVSKEENFFSKKAASSLKKYDYEVTFKNIKFPESHFDTIWTFEIPFEQASEMEVEQIVFQSSNLSLIHHCNYFVVPSDADGIYLSKTSFALGYSPGNSQIPFPEGMGFILPKKGKIIGELHVPPVSYPPTFSISLKFVRAQRPLFYVLNLLSTSHLKPNGQARLSIPADTVITLTGEIRLVKDELITHVNPHMHLLGQSVQSFAITPFNDTIPLIQINRWDFNRQDFYEFEKPVLLKKDTRIVLKMTYDNTSANPLNPNQPPREISEGWYTSQEMFTLLLISATFKN